VTHLQQALHLYHKAETSRCTLSGAAASAATGKLADKAALDGPHDTLRVLANVYHLMKKNGDALQVFQKTLQDVRSDIAQESTVILDEILLDMGRLYHDQCNIEIEIGAKVDRGKCSAAKALFEEALVIRRDLKRNRTAAETLMLIASLYSNLEMYDEARCSLKEALDFTRRCLGKERPDLVDYHQRMAFICQKQACELREQVNNHQEYLLRNSMSFYHSPGSRVRVAGLQNKLE